MGSRRLIQFVSHASALRHDAIEIRHDTSRALDCRVALLEQSLALGR
jgi:hypothetical protein